VFWNEKSAFATVETVQESKNSTNKQRIAKELSANLR